MPSRIPAWPSGPEPMPIRRRTVLMSGLALPLGLLAAKAAPATAALQPASSARLTLPAPTGPYRLGAVSLDLIDPSRPDPWAPSIPFREMVVTMWYPAGEPDGHPRAPYFTPNLARAFEQGQGLPVLNWPVTHAHLGAPVLRRAGGWPVVLFVPGAGNLRNQTTALVEDLASHGHVVVTIDFVRCSCVVELPDGTIAHSAVPNPTNATELPLTIKEVDSRVTDLRFVLDQLAVLNLGGNPDHERRPLPRGLRGALDLRRTGMFGHSDGGSTTGHMMHVDSRVKAGVDLDGTLWTPQGVAGSNGALLLFGEQVLAPAESSSWDEFWIRQRGPKLQLSLQGSLHNTFTDVAVLLPQIAPIIGLPPGEVALDAGTIKGPRAVTVVRDYVRAWFGKHLSHHDSHLLAGPSPRYPEVTFVR